MNTLTSISTSLESFNYLFDENTQTLLELNKNYERSISFYTILDRFIFSASISNTNDLIVDLIVFNFLFFLLLKHLSFFNYKFCSDIVCYDNPISKKRFTVIYIMQSIVDNSWLRVRFNISNLFKTISLSSIFGSSVWPEREAFDMFGIRFFKLSDLRRILTDYFFKGFAKRKDFSLVGYFYTQYSNIKKLLINLNQETSYSIQNYTSKNDTLSSQPFSREMKNHAKHLTFVIICHYSVYYSTTIEYENTN